MISIAVADHLGHTTFHIFCQAGNLNFAKYLIGVDQGPLQVTATDTMGNLPLHHACEGGNCEVVSCILDQSTFGVTSQN